MTKEAIILIALIGLGAMGTIAPIAQAAMDTVTGIDLDISNNQMGNDFGAKMIDANNNRTN